MKSALEMLSDWKRSGADREQRSAQPVSDPGVELGRWPPLYRYLVAGLEMSPRKLQRAEAVELVREAARKAGIELGGKEVGDG